MTRCDQCDYVPLTQYTSVRPPPWTDDDQGLNFFTCKRCGAVTIQKFDARTSYGQVWMLDSEVLGLLRMDAYPQAVLNYVLSEDFRANRAVTMGLFRGWARNSLALSVVARGLLSALPDRQGRRLIEALQMLQFSMSELVTRLADGRAIPPMEDASHVIAVLEGNQTYALKPEDAANARLLALDILEMIVHPQLLGSVPREEELNIEAVLDHGNLLERSRSEIVRARRAMGAEGVGRLHEEGLFLMGVLLRRSAWLPRILSAEVWDCLLGLYSQFRAVSDPALEGAYRAVEALVDHQIVQLGLEPITWKEGGHSYLHPKHGWVLFLPDLEPKIEMYGGINDGKLLGSFALWEEVEKLLSKTTSRS